MEYGKVIEDFRKKHSMSQTDLAAIMGVTPQAVGQWEREQKRPSLTRMVEYSIGGDRRAELCKLLLKAMYPEVF